MDWLVNSLTAIVVVLALMGILYWGRGRHGSHGGHGGHCCGSGRHEQGGDMKTTTPGPNGVGAERKEKSHCH